MTTLLVTGATGTVGQIVVRLLLERGHDVIALVRGKNGENAQERMRKIVPGAERLTVLEGDILEPFAGVRTGDIAQLYGNVHGLVHSAASIKFIETPDKLVHRTNVEGTKNALNLASALRIPAICYVGTAYANGNKSFCLEDAVPVDPLIQRNAYELSKALAEKLVRESGIPFSILRPAIVTGDYHTGFTPEVNSGYGGWFEVLFRHGKAIQKEWKQDPQKLLGSGIHVDSQGVITLPITISATKVGPLHLVPRDWVGSTLVGLIESPVQNMTFHLTHPNPPSVKFVIEQSLEHLGIRGFKIGSSDHAPSGRAGAIQRVIQGQLAQFNPYTRQDVQKFSNSNTREVLGPRWVAPPPITPDYFARLLDYAISQNFGRERELVSTGRT
ncbi:MAG: hypothetical protein A2842_02515 [Candidatus Wildermuthbacteria bacterium RIFCSPHIGHO2_01_FULL_48_25]|uniref:Thioester reductase (TE) domain-containing protein n=1 Tax=Candidatus Wildermuthbacteria bacterium RIFCSPLOWO2_01_FULL_48_16 TaxID=1802461 RepID=A0A1G2RJ86_9BACT|nr:MAG: hypothetical protein A2842_02515 [Candidatus Wildermuthbacteria bacterium RIFCSPHIGHO2_01_FULL_48_25]OHA69182.1 MAG: hypothetical protein A3J57_02545 [Candidatus Wildermuthbacteria bacterium RIFCSPHIGHO2_02_FULL_49_12b]OHA72906.1 MAG: hypothetical protein A3B24_03365 [Candidatus Wildermuthbacteria bacterium RIFCSPLOWO2_01_FULL_48_16]